MELGNLRQELLNSLRGSTFHIPDLGSLFDDWPQYVNPQLGQLQKDVDERLMR